MAVGDPEGGHPPDIVVDLWLGPLALVWVIWVLGLTKVFFFLIGFNRRVFNKFLIMNTFSFCKQV